MNIGAALLLLLLASYIIKYAADQFDLAADYLGRHMPPGTSGATIKAVGSSLPELLTGIAFVFTVSKISVTEGMLSAIAVTAGSAVFNIVIIPALVVLFAASKRRAPHISVDKAVIWRDGLFLLVAEVSLIGILGLTVLSWPLAVLLICIYAAYAGFLLAQYMATQGRTGKSGPASPGQFTLVPPAGARPPPGSPIRRMLRLDLASVVCPDGRFDGSRAWVLLVTSVTIMGAACHLLAESIVGGAQALGVHPYIAAVIFAAAATSVPDTVLSVKDALKGRFEDSMANAIGSNIFDITVCVGVPLLLYTVFFGNIPLASSDGLNAQVQALRIVLLVVSLVVLALFLWGRTIGPGKAAVMLLMYAGWVSWIVTTAIA